MSQQLHTTTDGKDVQSLVKEMEKREVVLPDFQRDFVWKTTDVQKLLESVLNGYYIDTILTLPFVENSGEETFPTRKVEGVGEGSNPIGGKEMVLDGQQRLTTLYYALKAPDLALANTKYPMVYYLKFSKIVEADEEEDLGLDVIDQGRGWWSEDAEWDKDKRYKATKKLLNNDTEKQLKRDRIPFTVLRDKDAFKKWRRSMEEEVKDHEEYSKEDVDKFDDRTEVFRSYKVPIVKLDSGTEFSKVVKTFERINTQGLELGVFDILTARLYSSNVNLRDLWEDSMESSRKLEKFSEDVGVENARETVLKTLALSRGEECSDSGLRNLSGENFERDWKNAVKMLQRALDRLHSIGDGGFGIVEEIGYPYSSMIPVLANLLHEAEESGKVPDAKSIEKIHLWYWRSVFSGRYSGSADSTSFKDYEEVTEWLKGGELPEGLEDAEREIPINVDLKSTTAGSALYKGAMSLVALNKARDFNTFESVDLHNLDDHHIFPKSRLREGDTGKKYGKKERNNILNRTLIESKGNRYKYENDLPGSYIQDMISENGRTETVKMLKSHLMNEDAFMALQKNDYEKFLDGREKAMRSKIEEITKLDINWEIEYEELV